MPGNERISRDGIAPSAVVGRNCHFALDLARFTDVEVEFPCLALHMLKCPLRATWSDASMPGGEGRHQEVFRLNRSSTAPVARAIRLPSFGRG